VRCDIITNKSLIEKTRYVDRKTNQLLLRVDVNDEATDSFNIKEVAWDKYDAVIVSDYNKGFLCGQAIRLICLEHDNVFFDTKRRLECDLPRNLRFLKINEHELELNRGLALSLGEGPSTTNRQTKQIIVTHGSKGCWYAGKMYPCPEKIVGQDLSGAGDTFLSALAVLITEGGSVESAINFAQKCTGEVVKKRGVSTV
jgi:bifunctional ADP-heptose synthase (sugar kinase/adenylyltransferase)